jgi:hypothetical protein
MKLSPYLILAAGAAIVWWLWKYLQGAAAAGKVLPNDPTKNPTYKAAVNQQLSASIRDCTEVKHGTWVPNALGHGGSCEGVDYVTPAGTHVTDDPTFIERASGGNATGVYTGPPVPVAGYVYGQNSTVDPSRPSGFGAH